MSESLDIPAMAEVLHRKVAAVHGVKGRNLTQSVSRAGRNLPRRVRVQASEVAEATGMLGHPKLEPMLDTKAIKTAYKDVLAHLNGVDVTGERQKRILRSIGLIVCQVAFVIAVYVSVLVWRGLI